MLKSLFGERKTNMDLIKYGIKYINYPFAMICTGNRQKISYYNDCIHNQYRPYQENIQEQKDNLYNIVNYAIRKVPYYHDIAKIRKISISRETITEDIKKFPILTKEIIRKEGERLYSKDEIDFYIATSGGSTGEPVTLRHDKRLEILHPGSYFLSYAGYDIGDKVLLLWGSERDIIQGTIGLKAQISNRFIHRRKLLNSFMMTPEDMKTYIHIINNWKPKVILSYVQSIYELSRFIRENRISVVSPGGIVVSAGTLYSDWEQEIKSVFQCPVINQYGSRETPGIAISCIEDHQLHINTFMNYVEIVDDNDNNLPSDIDGNIIVTNLINKSMPLIRYKIGDMGSLSTKQICKCGRNLPCLNRVKGRTVNIFKRIDGTKIDGEYFTHLFYGIKGIKKFQVIQRDYEEIEIIVEMDNERKLENDFVDKIKHNIRIVMGESCNIQLKYSDKILPTKSGKYLYTISLL